MKNTVLSLILLSCLPAFGAPTLKATTPLAKKHQTLLAHELKEGPNFAKRFRVVKVECTKSCSQIVLLDVESGAVIDPQLTVKDDEKTVLLGDRVESKTDSSVLILRGCLNEQKDRCGTHHFELQGQKLTKKDFVPAPELPGKGK